MERTALKKWLSVFVTAAVTIASVSAASYSDFDAGADDVKTAVGETMDSSKFYQIKNAESGLLLTVEGGNVKLAEATASPTAENTWRFVQGEDSGFYKVQSQTGDKTKVLDIELTNGQELEVGNNVGVSSYMDKYTSDGENNYTNIIGDQRFKVIKEDNKYILATERQDWSDNDNGAFERIYCLDVDGTNVDADYIGSGTISSQYWTLEEVSFDGETMNTDVFYMFKNVGSQLYAQVAENAADNSAVVQGSANISQPLENDSWRLFHATGDLYFIISRTDPQLFIARVDGKAVIVRETSVSGTSGYGKIDSSRKFRFVKNPDGSLVIYAREGKADNGIYQNVLTADDTSGSQIAVTGVNDTANQNWNAHTFTTTTTTTTTTTSTTVTTSAVVSIPADLMASEYAHNFTVNNLTSNFYTFTKCNLSHSKGTVILNGENLTQCLKMETDTNISFTAPYDGKIVLVFGSPTPNIRLNGTKHRGTSNVMELDVSKGANTITKADQNNLFYMVYVPNEEQETSVTTQETTVTTTTTTTIVTSSEATSETTTETTTETTAVSTTGSTTVTTSVTSTTASSAASSTTVTSTTASSAASSSSTTASSAASSSSTTATSAATSTAVSSVSSVTSTSASKATSATSVTSVTSTAASTTAVTTTEDKKPLKGDVDLNGKVEISDLVLMQKYLLKADDLNPKQFTQADMDGSKTVNIFDWIMLKRVLLGMLGGE